MTSTDDPQEHAAPPAADAAPAMPAPSVDAEVTDRVPVDATTSDAADDAGAEALPQASTEPSAVQDPDVDGPAPEATPTEAAAAAAAPKATPDLSPAATGTRLAALFPALFVGPDGHGTWKAIKLRIHADIQARAPGQFSKRALGIFFSRYTTTTPYLKALAAPGAQRFDLDGQPAGEIAEEHRSAAAEEVERRRAIAIERRAAHRPAPARPAPTPRAEGPMSSPAAETTRTDRPPREGADRPRDARPPRREHDPRRTPRNDDAPRRHAGPPRGPRDEVRAARPAPHDPRPPPRERPPPSAPALPADPAQRERAQLLRAFEASPLSKANFCVLKRISETELDAQLTQARAERG